MNVTLINLSSIINESDIILIYDRKVHNLINDKTYNKSGIKQKAVI